MGAQTIRLSRTHSHKKEGGTTPAQARKERGVTDKEEWVVWNGSTGILDMAAIGHIEDGEDGRRAFLAPPYDVVGPFSIDEL